MASQVYPSGLAELLASANANDEITFTLTSSGTDITWEDIGHGTELTGAIVTDGTGQVIFESGGIGTPWAGPQIADPPEPQPFLPPFYYNNPELLEQLAELKRQLDELRMKPARPAPTPVPFGRELGARKFA